jgi:dTDP-4-amino-4,6-dideoxygalactose transaminase
MKREIKFNSLYSSSNYTKNLEKLFANYDLFRQKHFSNLCIELLQEDYPKSSILLTHSATAALEMIALALDIQAGDEIILPSYTFVSTANAFALRGAKLIFVDIETETLGIDPDLIEELISEKTKAIVAVHYGGQACQINRLKDIAQRNRIILIEDAAMTFGSSHDNQALGTFGDFGVVSFDITKHVSATQGGLLLINNQNYSEKLHQIYHLGTNRKAFEEKNVPYYEWVATGSKYQMPETNACILLAQLNQKEQLLSQLSILSETYFKALAPLVERKFLKAMGPYRQPNYHEVFIICHSKDERKELADYLKDSEIEAFFHYIPLHNSQFGYQYVFYGTNDRTTQISNTLLRLPLHQNMTKEDVLYVSNQVEKFYNYA